MDEFYKKLEEAVNDLPTGDIPVILGDWNAKIGKQLVSNLCIGKHGLGERNERGDRLKLYFESQRLCVLNTLFDKQPRRLHRMEERAIRLTTS